MSNITITNNDLGSVVLGHAVYNKDTLTFAGVATVKSGTILARDSVTLKLVPFVKGGATNGNGIPVAVIAYEVTSTGAGDVAVRPMVSGEVRLPRLVIDADGDASNVDQAVRDGLRDYAIVSVDVTELNILDNQ